MAPLSPETAPEASVAHGPERKKLVVIIKFEDPDMTESSSDEEPEPPLPLNMKKKKKMRVYRYEREWPSTPGPEEPLPETSALENSSITLSPPPPPPPPTTPQSLIEPPIRIPPSHVRLRKWGRYGAEIWAPAIQKRIWLGTYDTYEQAANVYRVAFRCLGRKQPQRRTRRATQKKEKKQSESSVANNMNLDDQTEGNSIGVIDHLAATNRVTPEERSETTNQHKNNMNAITKLG